MDHNLDPPDDDDVWCEQCEQSWEDCRCGTEEHWVHRDRTYWREAAADYGDIDDE